MIDLKDKIKNIIDSETESGRFSVLNDDSIQLIQQILNNYEITHDLKQDFENLPKKADLIVVVAPTGAGKDSLVSRINHENPEKNYIELNMDMFRYYFPQFIQDTSILRDKTFAQQTNEFSYEMYYTIQEILLQEFPGTNVIITGTLWKTDWIEEAFQKYRANENTDYDITISSLAVPSKDSAFSIIKRYVLFVDMAVKGISDNGELEYSSDFIPGTARYTSLEYHDATFNKFPENLEHFQRLFKNGELINHMNVYRRSNIENDYSENTLVYSSDMENSNENAVQVVERLRNGESQITPEDIDDLIKLISDKKNIKYFKEQGVFKEILQNLTEIFDMREKFKEKINLLIANDDKRIGDRDI